MSTDYTAAKAESLYFLTALASTFTPARLSMTGPSPWYAPIDVSCVSVSGSCGCKCLIAVSPYHVLSSTHYKLHNGCYSTFRDPSGALHTVECAGGMPVVPNTDMYVSVLKSPLPTTIRPMAMLPRDLRESQLVGFPLLLANQSAQLGARLVSAVAKSRIDMTQTLATWAYANAAPSRPLSDCWVGLIGGDSSSAAFTVMRSGSEFVPVVVGTAVTRSGSNLHGFYPDELQAAMDTLSAQAGSPPQRLRFFALPTTRQIGISTKARNSR